MRISFDIDDTIEAATFFAALNILFLENHAVFAELVTRQFLADHRVAVVPSLSAARKLVRSRTFDLVLSDYDLDDGKGDEFVRECRTLLPHLPIIAVSSHESGNAALIRAGASVVWSKMEFNRIQHVIEGSEKKTTGELGTVA